MNDTNIISMKDISFNADYNESYSYEDDCCGGLICDMEFTLHFDSIFIPVFYSLAVVVGLVGNGLVLMVLWKKRLSLNVTDIFILHLSIADTLVLLTLPFWAVEAVKGWIFGTAKQIQLRRYTGVQFFNLSFLHQINFFCGISMLFCISLDHYLSIVRAVEMYSRKKPMVIHCCCLMVWVFCILLSIPEWIYLVTMKNSRRQDKTECVLFYPSNYWLLNWHWYCRLLYHILAFALPALIMLFCYSCILLRLRRGCQGMQKKKPFRVIVALLLSFSIFWTPYNIALIIDTIKNNHIINLSNQMSCESTTLSIALTITSTLGYLNCCVKPVLYGVFWLKVS
ncbi:C-X-C chemokine receptor type 3-like [Pseudorasbora parva]|uniref:C-X-C chemokine receptor type 3-like n=1 Tax=Pseudorasbora parva TaxID=51549 RepID=UPI00351E3737